MVSPQCAPATARYNQPTQPASFAKKAFVSLTQQQGQFKRGRDAAVPCCCCYHDVSRPADDGLGPAGAPVSSDTLVPTAQQDQQALYARGVAARVALVQSFDGVSGWLTHALNL